MFTLCIFGAVIYFGWPVIEAGLILLPIPDPNDIRTNARNLGNTLSTKGKELLGKAKEAANKGAASAVKNLPGEYR